MMEESTSTILAQIEKFNPKVLLNRATRRKLAKARRPSKKAKVRAENAERYAAK